MNTTFTISEVYKTAWDYTKKNLSFLLVSTFVFIVIAMVLDSVSREGGILSILDIASIAVATVFCIGMIKIGIIVSKEEIPQMENFKTDWLTFWRVILADILVMIFIAIGLVLLVVPGIIVAVRLSLTNYLIVEKQYSFWTAIKQSWAYTKGYSWKIFWLSVLSLVVFIISLIPFGLGAILSVPFLYMVYVIVAMKIMSGIHNEVSKVVTPAPTITNKSSQMPLITDEELEKKTEEINKAKEEVSKEKTITEDFSGEEKEESLEVEEIEVETEENEEDLKAEDSLDKTKTKSSSKELKPEGSPKKDDYKAV